MEFFTRIKDKLDSVTADYLGLYIPDINLIDVIEVLILAFFFYKVLITCSPGTWYHHP